jgi:cellulose synthase/poly-beta-1,6-N-acetylglucosamine synthase-like glycosyltransferase
MNDQTYDLLIGVPTAELGRQNVFQESLDALIKPPNSAVCRVRGQSVSHNRNIIIETALKFKAKHIFFLDDDQVFPPDTLMKLLAHDKDYVVGHYCMRDFPFRSVIFDDARPDGLVHTYDMTKAPHSGLVRIQASGAGGLLIKTDALLRTSPLLRRDGKKAWFTLGQLEPDMWCDDIDFCKLMREAEIKMYCDLGTPLGHITNATVWPFCNNGKWGQVLDVNGIQIVVPEKSNG